MSKALTAVIGGAIVFFTFAMPAYAQLLTFVAATGADGRPCTVQTQPCRTLDRAIDATTAGGEIRLLSSLPNQAATIDKSLTVEGAGHTMIGAVTINSATAVVTLRDLSLNGRGTNATGVSIVNAAVVHVENSTFERYTQDGMLLGAGVATELFVSGSVSRDNGQSGLDVHGPTTARLTIEDSRFHNNRAGVSIAGGEATVGRSIASGNDGGGFASIGFHVSGGARATFTHTLALDNESQGFLVLTGAEVELESCVIRGNGEGVKTASSDAVVRISNSVVTNNVVDGLDNSTVGATMFTRGNNIVAGNPFDVDGTLTPLAAQ